MSACQCCVQRRRRWGWGADPPPPAAATAAAAARVREAPLVHIKTAGSSSAPRALPTPRIQPPGLIMYSPEATILLVLLTAIIQPGSLQLLLLTPYLPSSALSTREGQRGSKRCSIFRSSEDAAADLQTLHPRDLPSEPLPERRRLYSRKAQLPVCARMDGTILPQLVFSVSTFFS